MDFSPDNESGLRRAFSLSRRPFVLIAIGRATPEQIASIPLEELRFLAEAAGLSLRHERAKSAMDHWSRDANRHIAIKLARDRITAEILRRTAVPSRMVKKPQTDPRLPGVGTRCD